MYKNLPLSIKETIMEFLKNYTNFSKIVIENRKAVKHMGYTWLIGIYSDTNYLILKDLLSENDRILTVLKEKYFFFIPTHAEANLSTYESVNASMHDTFKVASKESKPKLSSQSYTRELTCYLQIYRQFCEEIIPYIDFN